MQSLWCRYSPGVCTPGWEDGVGWVAGLGGSWQGSRGSRGGEQGQLVDGEEHVPWTGGGERFP